MRVLMALLLIAASAGTGGGAQSAAPFSITISTDKPTVKAGSDVYVEIRMTNTSNHSVDCTHQSQDFLDRSFEYEVRDGSRKLIPKLERNVPLESDGVSGSPRSIKPGETCEAFGGYVSHPYDMSRPGEYTIQVSRRISGNPRDGVVKSNRITITVTP